MYKEGKLFRVERPDGATVVNGLTMAEASQLAIDSYTNPSTFSELQIICGLQFADREVLEHELAVIETQQPILERNKADYETIWKMVDRTDVNKPNERSFVLSAAHTGAAQALREMKADMQKQTESFYASAAMYSAEMAALCLERLGGAPLVILGRPFTYTDGYLSTEISDEHNFITVLFGPLSELRAKEQLLHQRKPTGRKKDKIKVTGARMQDWGNLMQALECVSKF